MVQNGSITAFKNLFADNLPGLLVLCNLAGSQSRNCHLGHQIVDNDIEEFDRLIRSWASVDGVAMRVKGQEWLAISKSDICSLSETLSQYRKQQEIEVGWRSIGRKDGLTKINESSIKVTITRAARCLYTVAKVDDDQRLIDELFNNCYGFPPDKPIELSAILNSERLTWRSVSRYPSESPYSCLFCFGDKFDWYDGDSSVYSGTGICKKCGAEIDITAIP